MARGDYTPEIRTSLGSSRPGRVNTSPPKDSPAEMARDASRGIKQGSAADTKMDAMQAQAKQGPRPPPMQTAPTGNLPPDTPHIAAATSIAHAILNRRPGGM